VNGRRPGGWLLLGALLLAGCAGEPPSGLGVHDGHLAACPQSPNCVASRAADPDHRIGAIDYRSSRAQALQRLVLTVEALPRTRIVAHRDGYLHAEARSALFGFADDLEFYLPPGRQQIEVRSAARSGWYDFGVNRRRIERIRKAFVDTSPAAD
jgi:uncharacterized protein (DUF1499 family)